MPKYAAIRSKLQTGDIVLFSGKGGISTGIKWMTDSKWSHVGMVINVPEWDFVLLWESTTLSSLRDLETGTARKGVQLVPLSERIQSYNGEASVRHLTCQRTPQMANTLSALRKEVKGRPYEEYETELIKAAYDGPLGANTEDLRTLFCSELVAEAYQRMGILSEDPASNEYTPKDFSEAGKLKLLKGSTLSKEIKIQRG